MAIDLKTTKMLWGRAAARCAICRIQLYTDVTETDDSTLIGEMCHIVAESPDGPRGDRNFPPDRINLYGNLILLCPNHHTEIDKSPANYPVKKLTDLKQHHEDWVLKSLPTFDARKQRDEEIYAGYIAEWVIRSELDLWTEWSSWVLGGGQPSMRVDLDRQLFELREWLLKRVWPGRVPRLEHAFENFRRVLHDFQETFRKCAEPLHPDSESIVTRKFYKIDDWNPELYNRLLKQYEAHVDLVQDLMLELTRAANLLCDEIRNHIHPSFRLKEGRVAVMSGPHLDFSFKKFVPIYSDVEATLAQPYPGLKNFKSVLETRDRHYTGVKDTLPELD